MVLCIFIAVMEGVIVGILLGFMLRPKEKPSGTLAVDIYGDQPMKLTFDVGLTEILQTKTITLNVLDISDETAYEAEMTEQVLQSY